MCYIFYKLPPGTCHRHAGYMGTSQPLVALIYVSTEFQSFGSIYLCQQVAALTAECSTGDYELISIPWSRVIHGLGLHAY
jgi:hypothetical protein